MIFIFEEATTKGFFDCFETIATILGNIGIFAITAYGFWLYHFSKNVKVTSYSPSYSRYFGDAINCTIYNKTMSPKIITDISIVWDNKYLMTIKKYDEPMLLEPFHSYNIAGDRYSESIVFPMAIDIYFRLGTPEKSILVPFQGKIKKKQKLETITKQTIKVDDVVISEQVKYVLTYWYKGKDKIYKIYITKDGLMDKNLRNFNVVPSEIIGNSDKMLKFFKDSFDDENWNFVINEIGR